MALLHTDLHTYLQNVEANIGDALKNQIKAHLMKHAEEVVEKAAIELAQGLKMHIEEMRHPNLHTFEMQLNVWVKDKKVL